MQILLEVLPNVLLDYITGENIYFKNKNQIWIINGAEELWLYCRIKIGR